MWGCGNCGLEEASRIYSRARKYKTYCGAQTQAKSYIFYVVLLPFYIKPTKLYQLSDIQPIVDHFTVLYSRTFN
jgi:hypothetical protein